MVAWYFMYKYADFIKLAFLTTVKACGKIGCERVKRSELL